jgi:hypothetical protein
MGEAVKQVEIQVEMEPAVEEPWFEPVTIVRVESKPKKVEAKPKKVEPSKKKRGRPAKGAK